MKRYRPLSTDNERLLEVLRSRGPVQVQNGLMRCADREIALALGRMDEEDIASALSRIPQQKARRVREELRYQKRLRITEEQYRRMVERVIAAVSGGQTTATPRSYIRPRDRRQ